MTSQPPLPAPSRRVSRGWLAFAVSGGVVAIGILAQGAPELLATTSAVFHDTDLDNLSDVQEEVLGTDPSAPDSDLDGVDDLEEIARGTDPVDGLDVPVGVDFGVGVAGRVESDQLMISVAFYLPEADLTGMSFDIGVRIDESLVSLPPSVYLSGSNVDFVPGSAGSNDVIVLLQTPYPAASVSALSSVSFYGTVTPPGETEPTSADVINVIDMGGVLTGVEFSPITGGSIYTPLGSGSAPSSSPGQSCVQDSAPVGNSGAVVTHLVESAGCEDADSSCSSNCADMAGSTIDVIDPGALIGG